MSSDMPAKRRRLTWGELLYCISLLAILLLFLVPLSVRAYRSIGRDACINNLKQWGAIFKMYASENKGYYPRCATKNERTNADPPGHGFVTTPYGPSVYPDYVSDLNIYFCPAGDAEAKDYTRCPGGRWCNLKTSQLDARNFGDCSYTYFGWAVTREDEFAAVVACLVIKDRNDSASNPQTADKDLDFEDFGGATALQAALRADVRTQFEAAHLPFPLIAGNGYKAGIYRIREGIERFLITEVNGPSAAHECIVPVMWDRASKGSKRFSHGPRGCNTLYLDGHVKFDSYDSPTSDVCLELSRMIE